MNTGTLFVLTNDGMRPANLKRKGDLGNAKRPIVYLTDPHAALELALWCYEEDRVPLLAERDPAVAASEAARYLADLLLTDEGALDLLGPQLLEQNLKLPRILLVGESSADVARFAELADEVALLG